MTRTIAVPDDLYERLAALARPFQDKEPADVIRWLVDGKDPTSETANAEAPAASTASGVLEGRAPRERGAIVELDGVVIKAQTVPDLCEQVMDVLHLKGHRRTLLELAPYSTSRQRYLYAKSPIHPNGNEFFCPIESHGLYVETHKNYQTAIKQLTKLASKCGSKLSYRGN